MKKYFILTLTLLMLGCPQHPSKKENITSKEEVMFNIFKKKPAPSEKVSHADYNNIFDSKIVEGVPIEIVEIGDLVVTSGKIVVCDPLVAPDMPPLKKKIQSGKYPIKIYVAKTENSGDRYAVAKLEISDKKAEKWVLALRDGENVSDLKEDGDFFGFPVDAGLGGFFDYEAGIQYKEFIDDFMKQHPNGNIYDDFFAAEFKKNAKEPENPTDYGDWVNFKLPSSDLNITMFQSGYGDGVYPAYWGMTMSNEIVSLIIDFHVLLLPDA